LVLYRKTLIFRVFCKEFKTIIFLSTLTHSYYVSATLLNAGEEEEEQQQQQAVALAEATAIAEQQQQ